MIKCENQGQSMIFLLVIIPLMVVIAGIVIRGGQTLLIHNRAQNLCHRKVLDALAIQAQGLSALGKLNPVAQRIIDIRRIADMALEASILWPEAIPIILRARKMLVAAQKIMGATQAGIKLRSTLEASQVLHSAPPKNWLGKIRETYKPSLPLPMHSSPYALVLHVQKQKDYEKETGAPLELDGDFNDRQVVRGEIKVFLDSFLQPWTDSWGRHTSPPTSLQCYSYVKMDNLEDSWKVLLGPNPANL